ncbi:hypothetical protein [Sphingopyxis sp.]|uniref:hypothetical protein n=1 Tax=Sphingopyxis sp. TaxID=1908224 RepID=UPI001E166F9D|nr:hypothetical protein [Sphingopyxis sp.]MBW8294740.1 hypothetical protein [Sphingopyxis sp.]
MIPLAACFLIAAVAQAKPPAVSAPEVTAPVISEAAKSSAKNASVRKFGSTQNADRPCAPGTEDRTSDLCAQWKAADAAEEAARWSFWQMALTGLGLLLGAITMGAAIAAAVYAKRAAKAAEDAVKTAETATDHAAKAAEAAIVGTKQAMEGNRIARESQIAQLRPYLYVHELNAVFGHLLSYDLIADTAEISLTFKCYGQSPAKKIGLNIRTLYVEGDVDEIDPAIWGIPRLLSDLPPGEISAPHTEVIGDLTKWHESLTTGRASIVIDGRLRYELAGGGERMTCFRFHTNGADYAESRFTKTASGNDAT